MMYHEKFVASIKADNDILRELSGEVRLPFGSEYSILMKTLNNKKVKASITIDGEDVLDGSQVVIRPNATLDLIGFMVDSCVKNKFKFIEKTKKISDYRGDRLDDGLVRIEYWFEETPRYYHSVNTYHGGICGQSLIGSSSKIHPNDRLRGITEEFPIFGECQGIVPPYGKGPGITYDNLNNSYSAQQSEDGITVKGSEVNQKFVSDHANYEPNGHIIVLKLIGGKTVTKPIKVRTKMTCPTCGKRNSSKLKYCGECGTYLL